MGRELFDATIPGEWEIIDGKMYKGSSLINGNFELVDKIGSLTQGTVTVFQGDTRIATNVKKTEGSRAVGTKVSEKVAQVVLKNGQKYVGEAEVVGTINQTAYEPIKNSQGEIIGIWYVGVPNTPYDELFNSVRNQILVAILIELLVASVLFWFLITSNVRPLEKQLEIIMEHVEEISKGNLQLEPIQFKNNATLIRLSNAINKMTEDLRELVGKVFNSFGQVTDSSLQLATSVDQTAQASTTMASAIFQIANGTKTQQDAVDTATSLVKEMADKLQHFYKNTHLIVNDSAQTAQSAVEGEKIINKTIRQIANIETAVNNSAQVVKALGERSNEISEIVDTIAGIAAQTNLLALNAAIESARAGEQGKGFAVVADEVRKLAEESRDATQQIADLISQIQKDTHHAVSTMELGTIEVKRGTEIVTSAGQTFSEISELITHVTGSIQEITQEIEGIINNSERTVHIVNDINRVSASIADESQTVSASTDELTATMEEIASLGQNLSNMAAEVQNMTQRFKI
ncbi:MAG TPA: methyl-accepting chemotaxis protein [Desulfitobacterium dehalogenans]|uniref:Methyl-accepting chemotaxis protein n=1 Tax=Desulfitobacterium dehalogenans TaxID=36854 RepID=A0A7C7D5D4_9FIRM|nr:methyl-accepting chemotaxis protein [Desulfitobacterium dehalogenans]